MTFVGNKAIDHNTLYEYMIGGTEERDTKKAPAIPFVEGDMATGVARIRGYYESEGRLDAKIEEPEITYSADHSAADVTVRIAEGPRYTFGQIDFVGEPAFGRDQLINGLGEPTTNPYTTQRLNTMEHNLLYYYKTHGYYAATVSAAADVEESHARQAEQPARPRRLHRESRAGLSLRRRDRERARPAQARAFSSTASASSAARSTRRRCSTRSSASC